MLRIASSSGDFMDRPAGLPHFRYLKSPILSAPRIIAIFPVGLLIPIWVIICYGWPISFWSSHDDYSYLALAHALSLESSLRDGLVYPDAGLIDHPGLPYYVVSWICLRIAALFAGAADAVSYGLNDADGFYLATRVAAGLITTATVCACWRLLAPLAAPWRLLAIGAFFAASPQSFYYGLTVLGNETFALPLAALLFWAVGRLGRAPLEGGGIWLLLGAVAAVGYLVKPLYLNLLCAVAVLAIVHAGYAATWLKTSWAIGIARRGALAGAAFVGTMLFALLPLIGRTGLRNLLAFHFNIVTHTQRYGTGDPGFVSLSAVDDAATTLLQTSALPYLVVSAVLLLIGTIAARRIAGTFDRAVVLWSAAALTGLGIAMAIVLKHYAPYYITAVSAMLPFVVAPVLGHRRLRWLAAGAIGFGLFVTVPLTHEFFSELSAARLTAAEDEAAIEAMPLQSGEARLWTYRVPSRWFAEAFVAQYSGVPRLSRSLANPQRQDFSSYSRVDRPYRYVVLDRSYYPDLNAVREAAKSLEPTQGFMVRMEKGDRLLLLKTMIVVERTTP